MQYFQLYNFNYRIQCNIIIRLPAKNQLEFCIILNVKLLIQIEVSHAQIENQSKDFLRI